MSEQKDKSTNEPVLHVFSDRSVLYDKKGNATQFDEGKASEAAKARLKGIRDTLKSGFLEKTIGEANSAETNFEALSEEHKECISKIISSVSSEVGRAIVGLSILQLTLKSIAPEQSIRLHKGNPSVKTFGWVEGIPMRSIDQNFITPVLRKYKLMNLNKFGFMMTRTLAENYPYSKLYKAAIRGAKDEWVKLVDAIELNEMDPKVGLLFFLNMLTKRSESFSANVDELLGLVNKYLSENKPDYNSIVKLISVFIDNSTYSARIFEISMHSLFQVLQENKVLEGYLKPISQMRSANKKHGNIGDIELTGTYDGLDILEAWDAKYGKSYLRDEIEELYDKLALHPQCKITGFVTNIPPDMREEIANRIAEISTIHDTEFRILEFEEWVEFQIERYELDKDKIANDWLLSIAESIGLRRRDIAPIDEPTGEWVQFLKEIISK